MKWGGDTGHAREMRRRLSPARLRGNRARLAPARCGALHARHATWQTPVCLRRGRAHPALASDGHGACSPIPANFAHCPVTGGGCRRYPSAPRAPQPAPPRLAASAGPVRGSSGSAFLPRAPSPSAIRDPSGACLRRTLCSGASAAIRRPAKKRRAAFLFRARDCQSFALFRMRIACVPHAAGRFCTIAQDRRGPCARAEWGTDPVSRTVKLRNLRNYQTAKPVRSSAALVASWQGLAAGL